MPNVLTAAAIVDCGHGGVISPKADLQVKLSVSGSRVLTAAALINQPVGPTCTTVPAPPPAGAPVSKICMHCTGISSAQSNKLKVHGVAVLLAPLAGSTDGMVKNVTPPPDKTVKATGVQNKLRAV